jgi:glycosyltransferase involved in cell wall biosynthesis
VATSVIFVVEANMVEGMMSETRAETTRALTVLVVHERYQQSGGEDVAVDADVSLLEGHGHRVVRFERHNDEIDGLGLLGRVHVAAGAIWSQASVRALGAVIDEVHPDVVHLHNTFPLLSPAVSRAAVRRRVPVVQTVHNYRMICADATLLRDGRVCTDCVGRRLPVPAVRFGCYHDSRAESGVVAAMQVVHRAARTFRTTSLFLPISQHVRSRLVNSGAVPADKARVRYNHISPDPGARSRGSDQGYIAFVGRLSVEKGVEVLLAAARLLPGVPVLVVGDGPRRAELERIAAEAGTGDVRFLGHLDRRAVTDVVRGARCLAFTSIWEEPLSLVLPEAAALGVPAVATDVGGAPECVGPGAGTLVPPDDPAALAAALRAAVADPVGWWERGRAARRHFESRFTADIAYGALLDAYRLVGVS